jgi:hypothetical protein
LAAEAIRTEQDMSYLPWYVGLVLVCLVAVSRILTNYHIKLRYQDILKVGFQPELIPPWVSALYMLGSIGFLGAAAWSFVMAWWAPLVLVAAFFIQLVLIPSAVPATSQDATDQQAAAAVDRAVKELDNAIEQLRVAGQGGPKNLGIESSIRRAMDAVEQAKSLIAEVPDPVQEFGLMKFLQVHLERLQAALDRPGTGSEFKSQ